MSTDMQLLDRVMHLFEHKLGLAVLSPDADLLKSGTMDSLAFVNMLLQLEKEFGVRITLENIDLERFRSVAKIADYLGSRLAEGADGARGGHPILGSTGVRHAGN